VWAPLIESVRAREILDSRGKPDDRGRGRNVVPAAVEEAMSPRARRPARTKRSRKTRRRSQALRAAKGVLKAVGAVNEIIGPAIEGWTPPRSARSTAR